MDYIEITAKTVNDAITEACKKLTVPSDHLEYEIVQEGSAGFLGFKTKDAIIKARVKNSVEDVAKDFLVKVFAGMDMMVSVTANFIEEEKVLNIELVGDEMGILIGKRGQTLDSIQYLTSLVINRSKDNYIRVKVDTENYRLRRKETLENLAKNISYKVKRTKKSFSLEPMNPYERRIIHSSLQDEKYVTTHSEGDEPYRRVIISNIK